MLSVDLRLPLDAYPLQLQFAAAASVTGIFGASGAGKTSLLEAIAGMRRAQGRIVLDDEVWLDSEAGIALPPEGRRVGYVPQDGLLFPHLDVRGNLTAAVGDTDERRLRKVCDLLEIHALLDRHVAGLSGGERQRVALGRAVCSDPKLLLLDEPLGSLDIPLRRRILPFLRDLREEFAIPMLFVSHDPTEVVALCDDLVVIRDGRKVDQGPPIALLSEPGIWSLGDQEGFENVVWGEVAETSANGSRVVLGGGVAIVVPEVEVAPGRHLLVAIPAQQILIATSDPSGLSARNHLRATITAVRSQGPQRLVAARVSEDVPELVAEVTEAACEELRLAPGRDVFLIIKTTGCRVLGETTRDVGRGSGR